MFQTEWAHRQKFLEKEPPAPNFINSTFSAKIDTIKSVQVTRWEEHCLECSPPACYKTCPMYLKRKDNRCMNFHYGMIQNKDFNGQFGYGVDLRFRKWGKLETKLHAKNVSIKQHKSLQNFDKGLTRSIAGISGVFGPKAVNFASRSGYFVMRSLAKNTAAQVEYISFDEFVIECYSFEDDSYNLILEYWKDNEISFKDSVVIKPGQNLHTISSSKMRLKNNGIFRIFPENDKQARIVFQWLDFITYFIESKQVGTQAIKPSEKVKCIAWDLDNTLWDGILIERISDKMVIKPDSLRLIEALDERGILQTIVSKNDHDEAFEMLKKLGLQEYFLHPAINWGQKSENLKTIASKLNINIDTFALIDDSDFERNEVSENLPQVRVYKDTEINDLLSYNELDVIVSEETRNRRQMYQKEIERSEILASYSNDYDKFLRSCMLEIELFVPHLEAEIIRCYELIQRTNQLNLSTNRYAEKDFRSMLQNPYHKCISFSCRDKFGTYGIVGYVTIQEETESILIKDFVLSCRVAQKYVERTVIKWISDVYGISGRDKVYALYKPTERNYKLRDEFISAGFKINGTESDSSIIMIYEKPETNEISGIVKIIDKVFQT
ncbi:HAD-superfamily phosphatase, subfamily IIIC/FkbH-like domain-containing protein [Aquiflexum balticum DSM 16537]|uniref:HAD-superfamily phosphatase, subfamily IIIC/FkbH-like domain-containing protein n=1 Tax=Aquiflexum balticum DSM 16537 TaxID=758820 RepID=A0A1W2HBR7_9BACT|nr:HAD-IIIC family phosphatase [Aquiflexum balticum]SMD46320.1 HAD-superfamily phosphatase, subfamily IIIC/FkbH-like domain-containing protein [Aquiflexum balticum DSM 16537]